MKSKYEWVGDVKSYKEPNQNKHSLKYNEPEENLTQNISQPKRKSKLFQIYRTGPLL